MCTVTVLPTTSFSSWTGWRTVASGSSSIATDLKYMVYTYPISSSDVPSTL